MNLEQLRNDCAIKQKKGIHFILASVLIWTAVAIIHHTNLPDYTKNLLTFCATTPLLPISYMISKLMKIDFTGKGNPLTSLGLLFSLNQILYLVLAMWAMNQAPDQLVMFLAIIFGAHLLPYSWLYQSNSYKVMSIVITLGMLLCGIFLEARWVATIMIGCEIIFSILLFIENKNYALKPVVQE